MKNQPVKIKSIEHNTHDVLHIVTEKPDDADFTPGQATEVFIDKEGWQNEGRPFTFTCLPKDRYLEFYIKTYPSRDGVTKELLELKAGDSLILNDVFGAIAYKGEGTFIAGGAGVTPFISILRDLREQGKLGANKLIFANKTRKDIILQDEFQTMLGDNFINILSEEETEDYPHGHISEGFIKKHATSLNGVFYVCGPPPMMDAVQEQLSNLNVKEEAIVTEEF
ncbi:ferredoxin reductase domain-containing protein [Marixanthomonas spongiae]|uniref:Flavodoxin reductase n=1 Tax=Marixanthomonas spongiae TaxID=2174845 RepID=A0A2U0I4B4_9FLAO|nr:flavodoxin reductase [Marixanthomonas spongiae]PVW15830.1 flavodoxin reductase [Marixanthomonas spongiae]